MPQEDIGFFLDETIPLREAVDIVHLTWGWLHPTQQLHVSSYSFPLHSFYALCELMLKELLKWEITFIPLPACLLQFDNVERILIKLGKIKVILISLKPV
jgi:hypothetical protein